MKTAKPETPKHEYEVRFVLTLTDQIDIPLLEQSLTDLFKVRCFQEIHNRVFGATALAREREGELSRRLDVLVGPVRVEEKQ
jgi:hypothetical protein